MDFYQKSSLDGWMIFLVSIFGDWLQTNVISPNFFNSCSFKRVGTYQWWSLHLCSLLWTPADLLRCHTPPPLPLLQWPTVTLGGGLGQKGRYREAKPGGPAWRWFVNNLKHDQPWTKQWTSQNTNWSITGWAPDVWSTGQVGAAEQGGHTSMWSSYLQHTWTRKKKKQTVS